MKTLQMANHLNIKQKIVGKTPERLHQPDPDQTGNQLSRAPVPALNIKITIPLKYFSNFQRFLDLPLINCIVELDLSLTRDCVLSKHHSNIKWVTLQINNTKIYVPVVTLSVNDNIKLLENKKQTFKRTISWNKYRSEITAQPKSNNLDYLIDLTFRNINGFFLLSFRNGDDDPARNYFDKYYMPLVEIK